MCEKCVEAAFSTAPKWQGRYDRAAVRRACRELDVNRPVRVICKADPAMRGRTTPPLAGRWYGSQWFDGESHVIEVARDLPLDIANHTILHELAHAAQAEREGPDSHDVNYAIAERRHGYSDNPYEVEAEEVADRLAADYDITRSA
jgi:hypothetical protein